MTLGSTDPARPPRAKARSQKNRPAPSCEAQTRQNPPPAFQPREHNKRGGAGRPTRKIVVCTWDSSRPAPGVMQRTARSLRTAFPAALAISWPVRHSPQTDGAWRRLTVRSIRKPAEPAWTRTPPVAASSHARRLRADRVRWPCRLSPARSPIIIDRAAKGVDKIHLRVERGGVLGR